MKILIKITQKVIEASKGCECRINSCLIARACNEIFDNCCVYARIPNKWGIHFGKHSILLPIEAQLLAKKFDKGMKIEPTSFEIDVPMEIIEQIGIREVYKCLSESKTLELVSI